MSWQPKASQACSFEAPILQKASISALSRTRSEDRGLLIAFGRIGPHPKIQIAAWSWSWCGDVRAGAGGVVTVVGRAGVTDIQRRIDIPIIDILTDLPIVLLRQRDFTRNKAQFSNTGSHDICKCVVCVRYNINASALCELSVS